MLNLKKSSIFFSKISRFFFYLLKNDIFAVYNFYGSFLSVFKIFFSIVDSKSLNYILVSKNFINLVFDKNCFKFIKFMSPFSFVWFFISFNSFLDFQSK